ncbi:uncharacterized protein LOC116179757 isoform X4 [Photinus pyralis]|uniref:uncharacterized protein LOC116162263 isoform X2 n=1 Tax=Photinus pyralis TaxID=7054 RepID=UPI001266F42B|nr:uncharacterized protein LOC116162263 isoform X2 [Photinus pyralis]XP_031344368.1 uncharacterized protein LOC116171583 isoform X4 [Photinus pyralis]XP_031348966.1 uncharacterized protein LOC116175047 isoform X5 [Photinus pyralis]XP_031350817.1 uncharacterized protein LOC116176416 isoform X2 [Photinus pyralis]XP_031355446.1 uncharacterized protein LOC116179757 isoform X4 [Photinus pyralis]
MVRDTTSDGKTPFPGGREVIRKALQLKNIPENTIEICLASITASTLKQYNSGLRLWWTFCNTRLVNPFCVTIPALLDFLTCQFNIGVSFGSLNSYRSAIAQIAGPEIASDFRVKRFFKGVFSLRPPRPRYENVWDPDIALGYARALNNKTLSLPCLTKKLVLLLALATGQRIQTLSLINIDNIVVLNDKVEIRIPNRIKTSGVNKLQPLLVLPFYKTDPNLCVAGVLLEYLKRTKEDRGQCMSLFITNKKPHRRASTQTIGRWIGQALKDCGLDTSQFKPQSTRHASTSKAARSGVSYDTIRLAAGWSSKSNTFARFYNRPVQDNTVFARAVLNIA